MSDVENENTEAVTGNDGDKTKIRTTKNKGLED